MEMRRARITTWDEDGGWQRQQLFVVCGGRGQHSSFDAGERIWRTTISCVPVDSRVEELSTPPFPYFK